MTASPPASPGAAPRWEVASARSGDDAACLALFQAVFGHAMPDPQWQWKYRGCEVRGTLLRRQGQPVAFFGGMPRQFVHAGRPRLGVQNGDVMVLPTERGVFSRRGALHEAAAHYFGTRVGPDRAYAFAFGFPNQRHFDLGVKLGLYAPAGRMVQLHWSPEKPRRRAIWRTWSALDAARAGTLAPAWRAMQRDWHDSCLPVRDAARWLYRYFEHPALRYEVRVLRWRWTGRTIAAVAMREHPTHLEWLDFVGPKSALADAVAEVRGRAACLGKPATALVSENIAADFAVGGATAAPSSIHVPVNAAAGQAECVGRLWLMGGDTDFL